VEVAHPSRNPCRAVLDHTDSQVGFAVEDSIDDERSEVFDRRMGCGYVVDGLQRAISPSEAGLLGPSVHRERALGKSAATKMENEWHPLLCERRPQWIEVDMAG